MTTPPTNDKALQQLRWLAARGAQFCLPAGRSKGQFPTGWQHNPQDLAAAEQHALQGGNVGLLCGQHSAGIVAIDVDVNWADQVARLGDLAHTVTVHRHNAPTRGKLLYQVDGDLPKSAAWREDPAAKKPDVELLSTGRHALIPPSQFEEGRYLLRGGQHGILQVTPAELAAVWFLLTGELLGEKHAPRESAPTGAGLTRNPFVAAVKARWDCLSVFQHFGRVTADQVQRRSNGELHARGNAGLLVKPDRWYCHGDGAGGDNLDAWHYCETGRVLDRGDQVAFWRVVESMAAAAGIEKPTRGASSTSTAAAATVEQAGDGEDVLTLSDQVTADLAAWGYSFAVDDLDDTLFVNGERYTDFHAAELRTRARDAGYGKKGRPSLGALEDMVRVLANRNRFHPVRDWLNGLQWDGRNHFGTLCMHFKDTHEPIRYANGQQLRMFDAWLRRWALGAVAKAMGNSRACQQNAVLVLDGEQNRGKSYFARWLCSAPELAGLFEESAVNPGDKEDARKQCTKFIWELSEIGSTFRSADREALKAFITHAERTFRRPYDRNSTVKPALASFVGTINNESGFLTDPTGNRRFLVVTLGSIDWAYSSKVQPDQFWSQIMHWYRDGQTWELTSEEAARRDDQNGNYEVPDVYEDALRRYFWFTNVEEDFATTEEIVQHLLQNGIRDNPRAMSMAVGAALRRMGRQRKRRWSDEKRGYSGIVPVTTGANPPT